MVRLDDLHFKYAHSGFALNIPELEIAPGAKVAFVGPSGSGKTTLLNLMAGILTPHRGTVKMGDRVVSSLSDRARRDFRIAQIGMVFQKFELVEYLQVKDNIILPYLINQSLRLTSQIRQQAKSIAAAMNLEDKWHRWPSGLSQGEQQRVAIGRAILVQPHWILADEPTGSLDPENKQRIIDLLFTQATENNTTLIVVTHDTAILDGFDRVVDFADFHDHSHSSARNPGDVS